MERWILDLGDDVLEELEFEMLNLATYLTQSGIRFQFDPKGIGLSKDIRIKYFLKEFAIDNEHKLANYKVVEEQVNAFFTEFKELQEERNPKETPKSATCLDRKSADSANLFGSAGTRESWGVESNKSSNSARANMTKNTLSEKVENSKKKSL